LRLEDLDHPKVKAAAAGEAYRDLRWLGLDGDAGPAASFPPAAEDAAATGLATAAARDPFVQSARTEWYGELLERLRQAGRIYPCACSRKDLATAASAPNSGDDLREMRYPGTCRGRFPDAAAAAAVAGREPGWRFRVEEEKATAFLDGFAGLQRSVLSHWSGDFLVARGDLAAYQLAVVADDHAMGITEVVRGDDLLPSSHRQLALYDAFGWQPPAFYHLPLVVGPDGRRLAKRHGDTRLSVLRRRGHGPERVLGWLAWSCGWIRGPREMDLADIRATGEFSRIPRDRIAVTDRDLEWMGFSRG
ncbi:MAG: tRNA glutamyl-Q(34) synthetase GluQRS, partial [Planctomycetes bacterium]|nr:tRNA glutamyl-Q(34) synthetase GluQRS [Planctomycetota bacterium]